MSSVTDLDQVGPPVEEQPYDTLNEEESPIEDADAAGDELDDSAPNWAFASFVAESEELLGLFKSLKPVEHSARINLIVRFERYLAIRARKWTRIENNKQANQTFRPSSPSTDFFEYFTDSKVSGAASASRSTSSIHDYDPV